LQQQERNFCVVQIEKLTLTETRKVLFYDVDIFGGELKNKNKYHNDNCHNIF